MVEATIYVGIDWRGRLAERVVREAAAILAREYGVPLEVSVVEIPSDSRESESRGLPVLMVDGIVVAEGRVPSIEEVVDGVFKMLEAARGVGPAGFPVFDDGVWDVVEEAIA
ncbi:hypothetical protein APE_1990 [Aeropyrum pernix K1]|uniref:Thioredoxin-like fold domain-containing protein n=1 Tax=Aeropyrum pernix (strain ATCC 700893 / DSM 11879 / JCM 9820 / NBRC 100138 / K1) TaxID=272557 RepID=Q9YAE9_AERPE|nr:hypothetical protein [Aeropyrum pernix]BAA81000.1 hypothetical protein APE_1990 [Aeropyrum pernix K1]